MTKTEELNHTTKQEVIKMKTMTKTAVLFFLTAAAAVFVFQENANAHCQIPCGIYDDYARVESMLEDAATIKKSMRMINELSGKTDAGSRNQTVRWVMNKEEHAEKIITTISSYFLTQRVKSSQEDYKERLAKHHAVIVSAMKAKQNTREKYVKILIEDIESLAPYYRSHDH